MTSEGLGEMFEGDSADTCTEKVPLMLMGGRVEGLECADPGVEICSPLFQGKLLLQFAISFLT